MKKSESRPYLELGKRIAEFRKRRGWSQDELAAKAGLAISSLKDIERGVAEGHLQTRQALADALKCSVADLYSGSTEAQTSPKEPFPSAEFFRTIIEEPDRITLEQAMRLIHEMKSGGEARRAMMLGLVFGSFEIAEPYLPAESPKLRALLKAL